MTPLVEYWLKANLFLLLFYGCYALLLRRHTFFALNRTYLITSLLLAFILPFVHVPGLAFPWPWETNVPAYASVSVGTITVLSSMSTSPEAPLLPEWPVLAVWAFLLVTAGLLARTCWRTVSLLRLIRQWPAQTFADHTLVLPNQAQTPTFSFFRYLVLNPEDAETEAVRQHELVHIRQKHSQDVLFLEVIHAFCWLNPVLFGYRQALRQVHEYLADRDATPQTPTHRDAYARFLVDYAFHLPEPIRRNNGYVTDSMAHSFGPDHPDSPSLKQRIQMLYQQHTPRRALWKYALVLPLATALLAMTTAPESAFTTPASSDVSVTPAEEMVHVMGYVLDPGKRAIPGATVVVRNGKKGTTTDWDGQFMMDVPASTTLIVNFVGFESKEVVVIPVNGEYNFYCELTPQAVDAPTMPMTNVPESVTVPAPDTGKSRGVGEDEVFTVVEQKPVFPGGIANMYRFIGANLRYPAAAARANVQGKVFVSFVVNTDGATDRIKILKGMGFGMDEEAIRVMEQMPKWIPGKQNGRPVAVMYNLPIAFRLNDKAKVDVLPSSDSKAQITYSTKDSVSIHGNGLTTIFNPGSFRVNDRINPPLYIIDGEEVTQEKWNELGLHPDTIQEISVYKDTAMARSIYGEKSRNGVIVVTTKKGAERKKKSE